MPTIVKNYLPLTVSDGTTMQVYVAYPSNATHLPGVIVLQEAFGVTEHIRDITERIAAEGYYAIAPELFHRTANKGFASGYDNFDAVKPHIEALTPANLTDDVTTTYKFMTRQNEVDESRIASIGFCLGGRVSFLAATVLPLKAAACFYGGNLTAMTADRVKNIQGALLLCWGGQDKGISKETRDNITTQLDTEGKDYVNVVFSKAGHAFFRDTDSRYHAASAIESWELVKAFWKIHI